jgi:fucose permease
VLRLGSATFFTFGILLTLLGATQAEVARDLSLDLAASGFLGAVLALGLGAGVLVAGPLVDRFARAPLFAGACLLSAAALLAIGPGLGYAGIVVLLLLVGLGCGVYDTLVNTLVVERNPQRSASALAIVHSAATVGAAGGPFLVRFLLNHGHWSLVFHALGWMHLALAVCAYSLRGSRPQGRASHAAPVKSRSAFLLAPAMIAFSVVMFAYVGVENGVTLFAVPWAVSLAEPERMGQWSISAFWFGLLIGRLSLIVRRSQRGLQLLAASGLIGGVIICASSALQLGPLVLVTMVAGIAIGPVYPITIALVAERMPAAAGTALGVAAAMGACGGFAIPWLVGAVGDALGLQVALIVLGAHAFVIAIAALAFANSYARAH